MASPEPLAIIGTAGGDQLRLLPGKRGGVPVIILAPYEFVSVAKVAMPTRRPAALDADRVAELIEVLRAAERQLRGNGG